MTSGPRMRALAGLARATNSNGVGRAGRVGDVSFEPVSGLPVHFASATGSGIRAGRPEHPLVGSGGGALGSSDGAGCEWEGLTVLENRWSSSGGSMLSHGWRMYFGLWPVADL